MQLEDNYTGDGWLKKIIKNRKSLNFSDEKFYKNSFDQLKLELHDEKTVICHLL